MSIDYRSALGKMRQRRLGDDAISIQKAELYESRGNHDATRYALGAMQEVDPDYTRVSFEEGNRVKDHLNSSLSVSINFRYQGSLPLNTHIRRASDVDLLVIHGGFFVFDSRGVQSASYTGGYDGLSAMVALRNECEESLSNRYYAAKVDKSGAKSITLSEGSFKRKIDVVPANWYDTKSYQQSGEEYYRDIQVLDKYTRERITNSPFLFKNKIEYKDVNTQGGTKKAIRMLKNIKNDSPRNVGLSTYDITSLIWHMADEKLNMPSFRELALLAHTQEFLDHLYHNPDIAKSLETPDGSRKIIDDDGKLSGMKQLSYEVDELSKAVYRELFPLKGDDYLGQIRENLQLQYV